LTCFLLDSFTAFYDIVLTTGWVGLHAIRTSVMMRTITFVSVQGVSKIINQLRRPTISSAISKSDEFHKPIYQDNILYQIRKHFPNTTTLSILDGGCGPGIIGIHLAKEGHDVTGMDYHRPSLNLAKSNAEKEGVSINLIEEDLFGYLKSLAIHSYDIGIRLEVLYTCVDYKDIIKEFSRVIKLGGLFIATFRSRFYFITTLLAQKQYHKAIYVADHSEGLLRISSTPAYYN